MMLLQPKLSLRVSQKQILTPGLVQMVSVLALNKLELADMINTELTENPVLEELENIVPLLDDVAARDEQKERESSAAALEEPPKTAEEKDPFEEIDFGSFFRDYLDPGMRTSVEMEDSEKPSFENFLSKPTTLSDHLLWQLGSLHVKDDVYRAAELVIGNLNDDGYLIATDDELLGLMEFEQSILEMPKPARAPAPSPETTAVPSDDLAAAAPATAPVSAEPQSAVEPVPVAESAGLLADATAAMSSRPSLVPPRTEPSRVPFSRDALREAIDLVRQLDPIGVGARDLRECLLAQLSYLKTIDRKNGNGNHVDEKQAIDDAIVMVDQHLHALQNKNYKDVAKTMGRPLETVMAAMEFIRTLDPRPGLRYNKAETRLIEPDVAFIKQGDEFIVVMNDEEVPQLRLNPGYRRLLHRDAADKETRNYVKERYKSAIQLIKNIEQRKQTIQRVCYAILARQRDFLDHGIDRLKPMMIKEVAEEIGVHPSTVSRAVANKYAHTPQGVFELRYFFTESVNGPEGGGTSLLILKRRVKKLIEEEDSAHPYTDEQITHILQSQGIQVTRRTVAKYREDMKIPSTHQRRVKD
ncbi:MAG TPA: RNA polymerase factor sigma-54 [Candidatus Angelobacter sp.]|nr:RNA polymerase factor sigma-54 [Candidatus Angelobacter sp.]